MSIKAERLALWTVAVMVLTTACQAPPPAPNDLSEADVAAVRALWENLEDDGTDWEAVASRLTSDFVHLDPRAEPLFGIEVWREWVEGMELGGEDCCYELEEISGSGDLAYIVWTFDGSWTESGALVETRTKGITLFRRMPDGSWRLSRNVWNPTPSTPAHPLQGAWSVTSIEPADGSAVIDPAQPGLYIFAGEHYSAFYTPGATPRAPSAAAFAPTPEEIAAQYASIIVNTGTYEISGSTITFRPTLARSPELAGGSTGANFQIEGDVLTLGVLPVVAANGASAGGGATLTLRRVE